MNPPAFPGGAGKTQLLDLTTTSHSSAVVIVEVRGELDLSVSERVQDALRAAIDPPPAALLVDLTDLDFCNSSGINVLLDLYQRCAADHIDLRLVIRHPLVRVLELVGLNDLFTLSESRAQAIADFESEIDCP